MGMKLGLMPGTPAAEMRSLGFEAVQLFYGGNRVDDDADPSVETIDAALNPGPIALAAMTLHIDLVGPKGAIGPEIERTVRVVKKSAALGSRFGDNEKPVLVWHPSGYPDAPDVDDAVIFRGLCDALSRVCTVAEQEQVSIAVELTRAGSVYSAESFLRIRDRVGSPALRVCIDAANFVPDRTPLRRAVRMLADDIVIAHAKDSSFADDGKVTHYGPVGTGKLDYAEYISCLKEYCSVPYLVLEYYKTREQMLHARDLILRYL
jgi:sugar phosphate isomerase/epimerase